ncbi:MAG: NADH-quinone oxidoreductase subunit H [Actinobacteria bacterium]|nr:NADH-quinone oxidoreductase subunit H [Actinomycetota bacterium]
MSGGDPLLAGHVDLAVVLIVLLKVVGIFAFLLVATMLMIWFERKFVSDLQNRVGPNTAGPFGVLQTLADGIKFFFKEDLKPARAELRVFILAPFLTVVPAFLLFTIIPFGGDFSNGHDGSVEMFGRTTYLQLADPAIGILFALAMSSIAVYGVMLAGWSSGSKYPLLGSVRASAQMVSYEAALGLSICAVVLTTGTLSTHEMVVSQAGSGWGNFIPNWNLLAAGIVPFVVFMIASQAELNRPPFDVVEAEQELVGSYHTEYSSIRFALFFVAEFMNSVTMAAIIATLFLGGPAGPALFGPGWLWGMIWFLVKVIGLLFVFVWVRGTVPRVRYDQLMDLGWKVLIPLSLGWILVLATFHVAREQHWNGVITIVIGGAVFLIGYGLLKFAIATSKARRLEGVVD